MRDLHNAFCIEGSLKDFRYYLQRLQQKTSAKLLLFFHKRERCPIRTIYNTGSQYSFSSIIPTSYNQREENRSFCQRKKWQQIEIEKSESLVSSYLMLSTLSTTSFLSQNKINSSKNM
ncbi:hypothetical protein CHUAL_013988 [Chamberlinius hualienensis]